MAGEHQCYRGNVRATDDDGRPLPADPKGCYQCGQAWCERCDPSPAALCHTCHGRGYSTAPLGSLVEAGLS